MEKEGNSISRGKFGSQDYRDIKAKYLRSRRAGGDREAAKWELKNFKNDVRNREIFLERINLFNELKKIDPEWEDRVIDKPIKKGENVDVPVWLQKKFFHEVLQKDDMWEKIVDDDIDQQYEDLFGEPFSIKEEYKDEVLKKILSEQELKILGEKKRCFEY